MLAPSAIETARLLLLSRSAAHPHGLGNRSGQVGRNLMFHYFTRGHRLFAERAARVARPVDDVHARRLRRARDRRRGAPPACPTSRAAICEVGGGVLLLDEARLLRRRRVPRRRADRRCCATSRCATTSPASSSSARTCPQQANRVDLDPHVRDVHGVPVPRITHSPHALRARRLGATSARRLRAICARAAPGG